MPVGRTLRSWRGGLVWLVLSVSMAVWNHPSVADAVPVRVGVHEGYGRMVFDWPAAITYSTDIQGRQATIRFDRPIESDLAAIRRGLSRYVSAAQTGGGMANL